MANEPAIRIQGKEKTIRDLLKGKRYKIDYFQREYRWETKHITELLEDLSNKFLTYYDPDHELKQVANYGNYFLGSLVISQKEGQYFIVDGQQRLTSITLLIMYLNHLQENKPKPVELNDLIFSEVFGERSFNLDIEDRTECMEALFKGLPYDANGQAASVVNLLGRYDDIRENFPDDLTNNALPYFIWWLLERVVLVEITAFSDEDAYVIFETMNDRGLSLSPTEMMKGYLLANINDPVVRDRLNELWRKQVLDLIKIAKEEEADFFKVWLRAKYAETIRDRKKGASNEDFEIIGTSFHKWVRDNHESIGLVKSDDYRDFIQHQFTMFAKEYVRVRQAAQQFKPEQEYVFYNASNYFTLQYPLILAPLTNGDDQQTIDQKIQLVSGFIDIFIARRVWNFRTLGYSAIVYTMFNLMKKIRSKTVEELKDILRTQVNEIQESFDTEDRFRVHQQNRYYVHRMLARITYHIERQSGVASSYPTYININLKGAKPFEVEHIWADKFDEHRDEFDHPQDFSEYRNRIGGLVLLPRGFNQSLNDDRYETKVKAYFGQNLLAKSLNDQCYQNNPSFLQYVQRSHLPFQSYSAFKKADLEARQELYRAICKEIWDPDRLFA